MQYKNNTADFSEHHGPDTFDVISCLINTANFSVCLWVLLSLINFYNYQKRKNIALKKNTFLVKYTCFTPLFPLIRIILTQSTLFVKWFSTHENDQVCQVLMSLSKVILFISSTTVYVFPWVKQRCLYQQPSMRHLNTNCIKAVSGTLLLFSIIISIGLCLTLVIPFRVSMDPYTKECVKKTTLSDVPLSTKIFYVFSIASFIVNQVSLLALFTYPLRKHNKRQSDNQNCKLSKMIVSTLRHAVYSTVVNTTGTIFTGFLVTFLCLKYNLPIHLQKSVADIGLSILLFSVIVSFVKWRSILTFSLSSKSSTRGNTKKSMDSGFY